MSGPAKLLVLVNVTVPPVSPVMASGSALLPLQTPLKVEVLPSSHSVLPVEPATCTAPENVPFPVVSSVPLVRQ